MSLYTKEHIPLYLTSARLIIAPIILPFLLVYLLPDNIWLTNILLTGLFVLFGLTDFLDGYLARKFKQESQLGKILDPIADKFLIYSTLIAILVVQKIYFFWVILLIGREFFMMGVRLVAQEYSMVVHVSWWGKAKTVAQVILLAFLILNPYQSLTFVQAPVWHTLEWFLIAVTLLLSLSSAVLYYRNFMKKILARVLDKGEK